MVGELELVHFLHTWPFTPSIFYHMSSIPKPAGSPAQGILVALIIMLIHRQSIPKMVGNRIYRRLHTRGLTNAWRYTL